MSSQNYKEEFAKKYSIPAEKIRIISNFTVGPKIITDDLKTLLLARHHLLGKTILIYTGRLSPEKNLRFLIQSFKEVRNRKQDVVLIIVGPGLSSKS